VDLSLTASGLQVRTESFLSILVGGIAFETPSDSSPLPAAEENATFRLASTRDEAFRPPPISPQKFKLIFKESLRGLSVGAPVTLSGITIGEVTEIHAQFDPESHEFIAPVTIEVDPARYGVDFLSDQETVLAERRNTVESFISRGLRAQLKTGSLISGARYVALEIFPDAVPVTLDWSKTPLELPTQPGQLESLEAGVSSFIKKLNNVPLEQIGTNLNRTIVGVQGTLTNTDNLLKDANRMITPGSLLDAQINSTLQQVGGAAQALRILADYLEQHPESLIHGKPGDAK
jgi:paraquat-inducible protein B